MERQKESYILKRARQVGGFWGKKRVLRRKQDSSEYLIFPPLADMKATFSIGIGWGRKRKTTLGRKSSSAKGKGRKNHQPDKGGEANPRHTPKHTTQKKISSLFIQQNYLNQRHNGGGGCEGMKKKGGIVGEKGGGW